MTSRTVALLAFIFLCCFSAQAAESRTFFAMDTVMTLQVPSAEETLLDCCEARVADLEEKLSVTEEGSWIARLNAGEVVNADDEVRALIAFALQMGAETDGALDITLYPVVRAWGFTTGDYRVPSEKEISALLTHVDYRAVSVSDAEIQLPEGMMIDLGSIAKGYVSDVLAELLRENGIESALMDLGGNVYCVGSKENGKPWRIGIQSPDGDGYIAALSVSDCAVVTSGAYERYFETEDVRYGHIFDPLTGHPVSGDLLSVTVIGENGARCDALSTALFVMGSEKACVWLEAHDDIEALLLNTEGLMITEGLRDCLKISENYADKVIRWIER